MKHMYAFIVYRQYGKLYSKQKRWPSLGFGGKGWAVSRWVVFMEMRKAEQEFLLDGRIISDLEYVPFFLLSRQDLY